MSAEGAVKAIVAVVAKCEEGVEYETDVGAACPECGDMLATTTTRTIQDGLRERYHKCTCALCIVRKIGRASCRERV